MTPNLVPTELQLDLFRALEDIHDLTNAITVILVDEEGVLLAASPNAARLDHISNQSTRRRR